MDAVDAGLDLGVSPKKSSVAVTGTLASAAERTAGDDNLDRSHTPIPATRTTPMTASKITKYL